MKRLCGFALFFLSLGMIIKCFMEGFWSFVLISLCLILSYVLFCK